MNQTELAALASDWIKYRHAPKDPAELERYAEVTEVYDLQYDNPEVLWLLILEIHRQDKSIAVQEVLSAGPVEGLLVQHGDAFIDRIEAQARQDPQFAKLLGGVWKNRMSDAVWGRLQGVWDRRGWDGIPD